MAQLGRPSLGEDARTLRQSTKISAREQAWLVEQYGSAHKGLRVALDELKAKKLGPKAKERPVRRAVGPPVIVARPVVPVRPDGEPVKCRIHRTWETLDEFFTQGVKMREKRCTACGHVVEERIG